VQSVGPDGLVVTLPGGEKQTAAVEARGANPGDRVTVGVRPEHLHVNMGSGGLKAKVMALESLGDAAYLYAEHGAAPDGLIARIPPLERHAHGDELQLTIAPDHCHVFDAAGNAFKRVSARALAA
jgi:multiple sugar transport system ATP-binding protein